MSLNSMRFGPELCGDLAAASAREWLVTDGVGGFAMGTVGGLRTRRYDGLLVVGDARIRLAVNERSGAASIRSATSSWLRSTSRTACRAGAGRSAT